MHPFFLDEEIKEEVESKLGLLCQVSVEQDKDISITVSTSTKIILGELKIPFIVEAGGYVLDFDYGTGIFLDEKVQNAVTGSLVKILK